MTVTQAITQSAALAETLCRGDWRGQLRQLAPGKDDGAVLLATWRLYLGLTDASPITV